MAAVATTYTDINARSHGRRMDPPHVILFVVMCLFALAMLFPFIWMVLTSLKPETEVVAFPPKLIPQVWSIDSYISVWQRIPFGRFFANSLVFAGGVTLISLTLDSMTAFALSRLALPGRKCRQIVEPGTPGGLRHLRDAFADQHQLPGIRQRQGPQQNAIDYGKHRRGCADTEGQQD